MSRGSVDRQYLIEFMNQCYVDQENNCGFCKKKSKYHFCKRTLLVEEELRLKKFNFERAHVNDWTIKYSKKDPDNFIIEPAS